MKSITLNAGEHTISSSKKELVKIKGLGTGIAIIIIHPPTGATGVMNIALPDSSAFKREADERPGYFADTGVPVLLTELSNVTGTQDTAGYIIKITGGAEIMNPDDIFNVGSRNAKVIKNKLKENRLVTTTEDIGGNYNRKVIVHINSGKVIIIAPGREELVM